MDPLRERVHVRLRLLRLLFLSSPVAAVSLAGVAILESLVPAALAMSTGAVIAGAARLTTAGSHLQAGWSVIGSPLAAFSAVLVASYVVTPARVVVQTLVRQRINDRVRRTVLRDLARPVTTDHLEDDTMLAAVNRLLQGELGVYSLGRLATSLVLSTGRYAAALLAASLIVLSVSVPLGLLLVGVTFAVQGRLTVVGVSVSTQMATMARYRRAWYFRDVCEDATSGKEVRIFGLSHWLVDRLGEEWEAGAVGFRRAVRGVVTAAAPLYAITTAVYALAYVEFGRMAATGALGVGLLATALTAARSVNDVAGLADDAQRHAYTLSGLSALDDVDRWTASPTAERSVRMTGGPEREIRFEAVSYAYPSGTAAVTQLEFTLPVGQSTAIVGPNGAGKTTIIKLLTGLAQPGAGRILVDGVPLDAIDLESWRAQLAVIFQDFARYELSMADNVSSLDRELPRSALERAVERVQARDVLDGLPRGWDTSLSRHFEGGVDLSGGQWQKVALARAVCAVERGATVLVLDEPTAALDVTAEAALFDRFLEITRGLTTVLVSHRFSTVRHAERIVVVDRGGVVEAGGHAELLAAGGLYAAMFNLQAERLGVGAS